MQCELSYGRFRGSMDKTIEVLVEKHTRGKSTLKVKQEKPRSPGSIIKVGQENPKNLRWKLVRQWYWLVNRLKIHADMQSVLIMRGSVHKASRIFRRAAFVCRGVKQEGEKWSEVDQKEVVSCYVSGGVALADQARPFTVALRG